MTDFAKQHALRGYRTTSRSAWLQMWLARPAVLLVVLSALFGPIMILMNPPLRGPDEPAHFLRVYAYAKGIFIPSTEVDGRKGIHLPASIHDDFSFFHSKTGKIWEPGFTFSDAFQEHRRLRSLARSGDADSRPPVFVPYQGSEAYTLAAYAPYTLAALVANLLDLDFVTTLMLMRFAGFAALTAVTAYAVAITPHLQWAFFLIAMLPASLYGRSVIGADGATVSFSLVVVALALRRLAGSTAADAVKRSFWMTLCVLAKPPQAAFVLLEPMIYRASDWPKRWPTIALVTAPGLALSLFWIWAVDAEMSAWRVYADAGLPPEQFSIGWKLGFMLENPLHFPRAMFAVLFGEAFGLWRQLIGVLGWLDTHFHVAVYALLSATFIATLFERIEIDRAVRLRIAGYSALVIAGYVTAVFLILFITWTPPEETTVWGVQGRYFTGILPLVALCITALANTSLSERIPRRAAIMGAMISGAACIEGLWRVNWAG